MTRRRHLRLAVPGILFGILACAKLEKVTYIQISGSPSVVVGESIQLTAATQYARDLNYTWSSDDDSIAQVNATGLVTGISAGNVLIRVIGTTTRAPGMHTLAVLAAPLPDLPNYDDWMLSAHADASAPAFNYWNDDGAISTDCARCHSNAGYQDYLGADGSAVGVVDAEAPTGTVVTCTTCHNDATVELSSVEFPSGVVVDELGAEARCMVCHQGRASTTDVDTMITDANVTDADTPDDDLLFLNIHYYAAGATLYAGRAKGGYQYTGKTYDWRFRHVPGFNTCIGCHNPHSLKVRVDECMNCHLNVASETDFAGLKDIRMMSSMTVDYDGDGNLTEGVYYEVQGLRETLAATIASYLATEALSAICYASATYPYWFIDTNGDGSCGSDETGYDNQYNQWTARLVRATYNYQVSLKDPGAFAHNAKYIIQLLHDAIEDLDATAVASLDREDPGHFNGAGTAARYWDSAEAISTSCSPCHGGADGYRFSSLTDSAQENLEQANGLDCYTCHETFGSEFTLAEVDHVTFPNGVELDTGDNVTNLCSRCHRGRESKDSVDAVIASGTLTFKNIHYLPAGSVLQGADAGVGYEYDGKTYADSTWNDGNDGMHFGGTGCNYCHDAGLTNHTFAPQDVLEPRCSACHAVDDVTEIRLFHSKDYDGDGSTMEKLSDELAGLEAALLTTMQTLATTNGSPLCYSSTAYPYFFKDTNADGACDSTEATSANKYTAWTAALLKASFNYQLSHKEPGAWAHNFDYVAQLLYDSIADLGGSTATLVRP